MASMHDLRPRRRILAVIAVATIALSTTGLAACGSSDGSTGSGSGSGDSSELEGVVRKPPLEVGAVSMPEVAADGTETPFTFKAPKGGLLFTAFGYTNCPDVCPTTLSDIRKALADLGDDADRVEVAFGTVDPERDTAEVMNAYLGSFVKDGHPLRTTDPAEKAAAEDAFEITSEVVKKPDGTVEVAHTARSFVIDDTGKVVVEWTFGTGSDVMASDLRKLLDQQS